MTLRVCSIDTLVVSDCAEQQPGSYRRIVRVDYRVPDFVSLEAKNLIFKVSTRWPGLEVDVTNAFMAAPAI